MEKQWRVTRFDQGQTNFMSRTGTESVTFQLSTTHAGVSYIRWGRTTCPTGVHKLYDGYMVGHQWLGKGSGGDYECAVSKPTFGRGKAGHQAGTGEMVGMEFDMWDGATDYLFSKDNLPNGKLYRQDMVCVRCYVADATDQFMLVGRQDCFNTGYDLQYFGYVVTDANWSDRQPTQYVCLDDASEGRVGGEGTNVQGEIYPVEMACGSLPCNPYVNQMEATCAVCTY